MTRNDDRIEDDQEEGMFDRASSTASGYLDRIFSSCSDDPKGSIHRAWGVSLIFVILYFVVSMFESKSVTVSQFAQVVLKMGVQSGVLFLLHYSTCFHHLMESYA